MILAKESDILIVIFWLSKIFMLLAKCLLLLQISGDNMFYQSDVFNPFYKILSVSLNFLNLFFCNLPWHYDERGTCAPYRNDAAGFIIQSADPFCLFLSISLSTFVSLSILVSLMFQKKQKKKTGNREQERSFRKIKEQYVTGS